MWDCLGAPRCPWFCCAGDAGCRLNRNHDYPVEILGAVDAAEQVTYVSGCASAACTRVSYCAIRIYTKIAIMGHLSCGVIFARSALCLSRSSELSGLERAGNAVMPPAEKSICVPGFRLSRDLEVGKTIRRMVLGRAESRNVFHSFGRYLLVCHDETS